MSISDPEIALRILEAPVVPPMGGKEAWDAHLEQMRARRCACRRLVQIMGGSYEHVEEAE